ncbi:MAG: hypothetical protein ACXWJB_01430 [Limisphaerales bacterium]
MRTPPNKALFPISVDNPGFTTSVVVAALNAIAEPYDEVLFLVADELQLYNKASSDLKSGQDLSQIISTFQRKNRYFEQRKKWLERIKSDVSGPLQHAKWTFYNVSDFTDQRFYHIFRNILLAFNTIPDFRNDVEETARNYCMRARGDVSDIDLGLSTAYILEEIALNVRIRVLEQVKDEYYLFKYPKPFLNLYANKYGIDVYTLAGIPNYTGEFPFLAYADGSWKPL